MAKLALVVILKTEVKRKNGRVNGPTHDTFSFNYVPSPSWTKRTCVAFPFPVLPLLRSTILRKPHQILRENVESLLAECHTGKRHERLVVTNDDDRVDEAGNV